MNQAIKDFIYNAKVRSNLSQLRIYGFTDVEINELIDLYGHEKIWLVMNVLTMAHLNNVIGNKNSL